MDPDAESATATALYTKFRQIDTIAKEYLTAHNLLATTTSGFEFLQLLMHQAHPLPTIKYIATVYIPKYSTFNDIYRYAREIGHYVSNHALKQREFSVKEVSHIFLSHLYNENYASAINKCEAAIQMTGNIDKIYLVPALVGTIDQLAPNPPSPTAAQPPPAPRHAPHIRSLLDYCNNHSASPEEYCNYIDDTGETPFIRSFQQGGGRSRFSCGGRGNNNASRNHGRSSGRGRQSNRYPNKSYKGTCNSCGMQNHHTDSHHFLFKLRQVLSYLGIDPNAAFKKRTHYQNQNSYAKNKNFVRDLMDAKCIPFQNADEDNFIDVVDGNHEVFTPDIINSIDDNAQDEWHAVSRPDTLSPQEDKIRDPLSTPRGDGVPAPTTAWRLDDLLNDEYCAKIHNASDKNFIEAATINHCFAPPSLQTLDTLKPEPEPPPTGPVITVTTVYPHEYMHDASYPAGILYTSNELLPQPTPPPNNDHLLWDTHVFPNSELNNRLFSPVAIIRTLAIHDKTHFTTPITKQFLKSHF